MVKNSTTKSSKVEKENNTMKTKKVRIVRKDCRVDTFEKKYGLPPGTIRNKDGRDTRGDKLIGTIRREALANK